jgi:uncharacterized protein
MVFLRYMNAFLTSKMYCMATATKTSTNPVVWFEIYVDDFNRAVTFYETVLAIHLNAMPDPSDQGMQMASFARQQDAPNSSGALIKMEGVKAGGNSTIVYFSCDDCAVETARVPGAGGRIFKDKMSIKPHGFMSLCFDSEGNMFGLHSMK